MLEHRRSGIAMPKAFDMEDFRRWAREYVGTLDPAVAAWHEPLETNAAAILELTSDARLTEPVRKLRLLIEQNVAANRMVYAEAENAADLIDAVKLAAKALKTLGVESQTRLVHIRTALQELKTVVETPR
ncbi:hypothetical protein MMEU_1358 [Mycobacterium marinum str. Europe]|nr:hypothetical protein MMEU_1358 [Mycobacterium marinum str. Europe]